VHHSGVESPAAPGDGSDQAAAFGYPHINSAASPHVDQAFERLNVGLITGVPVFLRPKGKTLVGQLPPQSRSSDFGMFMSDKIRNRRRLILPQ